MKSGARLLRDASGGAMRWLAAGLTLIAVSLPLLAVLSFAGSDTEGLWGHLQATVLPLYVSNTLLMTFGVIAFAVVTGVGTAWLVTIDRKSVV